MNPVLSHTPAANNDLVQLLQALARPTALIELALFAACLAGAWLLVRVLRNTTVLVAYGTDVPALAPLLEQAVVQVPRVLDKPGPAVMLSNFAPDGLELTVAFWIADAENGQLNVRSGVNLALLAALNSAGVVIPYPQRVLHLPAAKP